MDDRGGLGCGTLIGASILGCLGLFLLFSATFTHGSIGPALMLVAMATPCLIGAVKLVTGDLQRSAERRRSATASVERRILTLASAHQGRVTPTLVTMEVPGLDIAGAKAKLDAMARDGYCGVDSDDSGRPYYSFAIGATSNADDLSPEEWLRQHAGSARQHAGGAQRQRMTGDDTDQTNRNMEVR